MTLLTRCFAFCCLLLPLTLTLAQTSDVREGAIAGAPATRPYEPDVLVSTIDFKPDRNPTQKEISALGGLSGPLAPIGNADEDELLRQLNEAIQQGDLTPEAAQPEARVDRLRRSNRQFAFAMNDWNSRQWDKAVRSFRTFAEEFPDSPWVGEALLHVGEEAHLNGRYAEAREVLEYILKNTEGTFGNDSYEVHMKARQSLADLDISAGDVAGATEKLRDILKADRHWRRRAYARHWLHQMSLREGSQRQLLACGTEALAEVLKSAGKPGAAARLAKLRTPRDAGWSLAELQRLAQQEGVVMEGLKAPLIRSVALPATPHLERITNLASLRTPFIIHCGAGAARETWKSVPGGLGTGLGRMKGRPGPTALPIAYRIARGGHFWVVRKIDSKKLTALLFNPSEDTTYQVTWAQLDREWSGAALAPAEAVAKANVKLALMDRGAMEKTHGTGWEAHRVTGIGRTFGLQSSKTSCPLPASSSVPAAGEPTISINRISMNTFIEDTPLWYQTPVGPDVRITMSYNSQDYSNYGSSFGSQWMLNYDTYAKRLPNTNNDIVVVMPDGKQETYTYFGQALDPANKKKLTNIGPVYGGYTYDLVFPTGERWFYDRPAGAGTQQSRLVKIRDRWNYEISFQYVQHPVERVWDPQLLQYVFIYETVLRYITDAQNRTTTLNYIPGSRLLTSVVEPSGRTCTFAYPTTSKSGFAAPVPYGNVGQVTDMGGNVCSYGYDINGIWNVSTTRGNWNIRDEPSDGASLPAYTPEYLYPQYGSSMGQNWRITITDPLNQYEEFYYAAKHFDYPNSLDVRSWYVSKNHWKPNVVDDDVNDNNGSASTPKTEWVIGPKIGDNWYISKTKTPDGGIETYEYDTSVAKVNRVTSPRENALLAQNPAYVPKSTTVAYNGLGRVLAVTDELNHTTSVTYDTNGIDVLSIKDPLNRTVATYSLYNSAHQPTRVTDAQGVITTLTYKSWGALESIAEASNKPEKRTTTYTYDSSNRVSQISLTAGTSTANLGEFTYNARGLVQTSKDTRGLILAYEYTNLDQVDKITYPDGTYVDPNWCNCGVLNSVKNRAGRTTSYEYNDLKQLTKITDPATRTIQLNYDANGNVTDLLNESGSITHWTYDNMNRARTKTAAYVAGASADQSWDYDINGNVQQFTNARGQVTVYGYDDVDNLTAIDRPGTTDDVVFVYDEFNRVKSMTDQLGLTSWQYDVRGQVTLENGPWTVDNLSYDYDPLGRRSYMDNQTASGVLPERTSYTWDPLDRVTGIQSPAGDFTYDYADSSKLVSDINFPNLARTHFSWDSLGHLSSAISSKSNGTSSGRIADYVHTFDNRDIITSLATTIPGTTQVIDYTYDIVNRLTREKSQETLPLLDNAYNFDGPGNRQSVTSTSSGSTTTSTYSRGAANTYTKVTASGASSGVETITHDDDGNMTRFGTGTYVYDSANRPIQWTQVDATTGVNIHRTNWVYDGLDRVRRVIEYNWQNGAWVADTAAEQRLLYDGMDVVQERRSDNSVAVTNTWGLDVSQTLGGAGSAGGLLARTVKAVGATPQKILYAHHDGRGNIIALTKEGTTVGAGAATVARYAYDAYGIQLSASGVEASANPYRYQSKRYHQHSITSDFGYRFYSPRLGRFINRDPIGEAGGVNLYSYAENNPVNETDFYGLYAGIDDAIFAGGGAVVGIAGQGLSDLAAGEVSGWETYVGSAVGGAAGGEALLYVGPIAAGAIGGAVGNLTKQGLKNASGSQQGFDKNAFATDTIIGGATGLIPGVKVKGVTMGRGSANAVYNQMTTKFERGIIANVTPKTAAKMLTGRAVDKGLLPGQVLGSTADATKRRFPGNAGQSPTSCPK